MKIKDVVVEDFLNYKEPSMLIVSALCDWKCCTEAGLDISVCQNASLVSSPSKIISDETLLRMFCSDPITKAIVVGGLEPMLQIYELLSLIGCFRAHGENSPFVIYTGYYEREIPDHLQRLRQYRNIIVKFGRFIPNCLPRFDQVLGVMLASNNQYAVQLTP